MTKVTGGLQNTPKCPHRVVYIQQKHVIRGLRRGVNEILVA